ncbi:MAG: alpha-ketoacid dehydrogenase subunit beta [Anaerolineae bacterium]|jgi:pyruvate dehydrogenase E1 component beta subunit|nr:alpha-ketoacid dehydrogenase subunit beta [Anaerolineae bacterium]MDX9832903.1 alpha-ketoacid dehydrogenase subunit beta [Anaerolineae bacterium]
MTGRTLTFREAFNEAIRLEMRRDPNVIMIGEDIAGGAATHLEEKGDEAWGGDLGLTRGLVQEFGRERIRDTPISESAIMGAAVGAASTGLRPIAELMFVDFFGVCMDQIYNQGAKLRYMFGGKAKVPMVIETLFGAGFRAAGQHSQCLYSVFTHMPGLKVVVPSTPYNAKGLMSAAVRDDDPVIYFVHKVLLDTSGPVPEDNYVIPLGKAEIARQGSDATVVAIGRMRVFAEEAAATLADGGIDVEVVDPQSLSPLDEGTILESVKKTHRLVVVDEDTPRCSVASDIVSLAARQAFDYLDAPPQVVTAPHTPVPFSPALEDVYIPGPAAIVQAVRAVMA